MLQFWGMKSALIALVSVCAAALIALAFGGSANAQSADGPSYAPTGELIRPENFREWMFVTSGLGMTYNQPAQGAPARTPNFTNVYVNPSAYRSYVKTGEWPNGTMFILEIRASTSEGSINKGGHFQTDLVIIEASVKDARGQWALLRFRARHEDAGERAAVDGALLRMPP